MCTSGFMSADSGIYSEWVSFHSSVLHSDSDAVSEHTACWTAAELWFWLLELVSNQRRYVRQWLCSHT